jgi:hypothetical protein
VTWLNDAVLLAPAVLLDARTGWEPAGDDGFRVSVTDAGRTVSAQVFLDDEGRPRDFRTEDRWADLPGRPVGRPSGTCPTASGPVLRAPAGRGRRDGEAVAASVRRLRRREDGGECHRDLRRQVRTASQSRKSPTGARIAVTTARSGALSRDGSRRPGKTRWPRGPSSPVSVAVSYGSSGGYGGSPMGPLENSHSGRARRTAACRWARSRAGSSQLPW